MAKSGARESVMSVQCHKLKLKIHIHPLRREQVFHTGNSRVRSLTNQCVRVTDLVLRNVMLRILNSSIASFVAFLILSILSIRLIRDPLFQLPSLIPSISGYFNISPSTSMLGNSYRVFLIQFFKI